MPCFKNWPTQFKGDATKAYCCYCKVKLVSEITTIKKHLVSKNHIENAKSITGARPNLISNMFDKVSKVNEQVDNVKRAEILICGLLSEHNILFNAVDHLTQVLASNF